MMMTWLYLPPLALLFLLSLTGIWYHRFEDNLLQRMGMSLTCFGSLFSLYGLFSPNSMDHLRLIIIYGFAVFALGVAQRIYTKYKRSVL